MAALLHLQEDGQRTLCGLDIDWYYDDPAGADESIAPEHVRVAGVALSADEAAQLCIDCADAAVAAGWAPNERR